MSKTTNTFFPEVGAHAVRLVLDNQDQHGARWQTVLSISSKVGCASQTLNDWVKKTEVDSGKRSGIPSEMAEKIKALDRTFAAQSFERDLRFELTRKTATLRHTLFLR